MSENTGYANSYPDPRALSAHGFSSYAEYLRSAHWKAVKRRFYASGAARKIAGKVCCYGCRTTGKLLEVHHKTYKRLGAERSGDLIALCGECHDGAHNAHKANKRRGLWNASSGKQIRKYRGDK